MADRFWQAISPDRPDPKDYEKVEFWVNPERAGYLFKQGNFFDPWRRRWFVLKQGRLLWFKHPDDVTNTAVPRGVVRVDRCQVVSSAEDVIKKPNSLQLSTDGTPIYYIADSHKEKEEWINSLGRVIVQSSNAVTPEIHSYGQSSRS